MENSEFNRHSHTLGEETDTRAKWLESAGLAPLRAAEDAVNLTAKETLLLADGAIVGAAKQAAKDPLRAIGSAGGSFAAGAVLGAVVACDSPAIAAGAIAMGGIMTGTWLFDLVNPNDPKNQLRNAKLMIAMNDLARSRDSGALPRNMRLAEDALGPSALNVSLGLISACGSNRAFREASVGSAAHRFLNSLPCRLSQFGASLPTLAVPYLSPRAIYAFPTEGLPTSVLHLQEQHSERASRQSAI